MLPEEIEQNLVATLIFSLFARILQIGSASHMSFRYLITRQHAHLAPIQPCFWSSKVSTYFFPVNPSTKAFTSAGFSSLEASTQIGILIPLASSAATRAGWASAAAENGVPSCDARTTTYRPHAFSVCKISTAIDGESSLPFHPSRNQPLPSSRLVVPV